ncbi:hypothetical protein BC829DRAFT_26819 [Chytridium lagenaria]|nr:hypothetical protein BC829DRAFT_26819 [Chytridium lagenaria]
MESLLKDLKKSTDGASAGDGAFSSGFGEGRAGSGGDELDDATMAALFEQMTQNPEAAASLLQTLASLDGANQRNDEASASEESGPKFPPGMMGIDPLPGFVFKTKLAETKDNWKKGMKVFINVCYHEVIHLLPMLLWMRLQRRRRRGTMQRIRCH